MTQTQPSKSSKLGRRFASPGWRALSALWITWLAAGYPVSEGLACGPFLPGSTLTEGSHGLDRAPHFLFAFEIDRLLGRRRPTDYEAPAPGTPSDRSLQAELDDLRLALTGFIPGITSNRLEKSLQAYQSERAKIIRPLQDGATLRPDPKDPPRIGLRRPQVLASLPGEFADYFRGAIAWHEGEMAAARQAWMDLLNRPAQERRYRSTWAAFMLGRSWEDFKRERAIKFFRQTRWLATNGFSDSLALATDSLGYEARLHFRQGRFPEAIRLYLEQQRRGAPEAITSLYFASALALRDPRCEPVVLARDPVARDVITAYVLSLSPTDRYGRRERDMDGPVKEALLKGLSRVPKFGPKAAGWHRYANVADVWLEAVQTAGVVRLGQADRLALLAYQRNLPNLTQAWLRHAEPSRLTRWLQARLHLRAGEIEEAGALLASVCRSFSLAAEPNAPTSTSRPAEAVYFVHGADYRTSLEEQALAEWGVLLLARQQYVDALHALLLSSYWPDAAYVAERVLTVDELRDYIDRFWPLPSSGSPIQEPPSLSPRVNAESAETAKRLRYLLARRYGRLQQWDDARAYIPEEHRSLLNTLRLALEQGRDPVLPQTVRGSALAHAAKVLRRHGLKLVGTEAAPDWVLHQGQFAQAAHAERRATNDLPQSIRATPDELRRAGEHAPVYPHRFHYRWLATDLAWEAASLLPDRSEETARILALGGSWLKAQYPKEADRFYKALVNRCRNTALGAEADRRRWFPPIDEDGNLSLPPPKEPDADAARQGRDQPSTSPSL